MLKLNRVKSIVISSIAVVLALTLFSVNATVGQQSPFSEVKEKLSAISEEEKEVLQNLFILTQEIELMEKAEKELVLETEAIRKEIEDLEKAIAQEELVYEKKKESLKQVLKSYQRMGSGSFLEIILDSDSLSTFLQRINILRDLARNTEMLLEQLEASGKKLVDEKSELSAKLALLNDKQESLRKVINDKTELKAEKEEYLASLEGEKTYYQEYLYDLEKVWGELKPLMSETAEEFSRMIEEGGLPVDALKISFSLFEVKGIIDDNTINKVISANPRLEDMIFAFHPDSVEIRIPEKNLILNGIFIIQKGHILKFQAQEGSFFGMTLETGTLEELFGEEGMTLNLKPLLAGNNIHAVNIKEGYIEMIHRF